MIRRSLKNFFSRKKPAESRDEMSKTPLMMPFVEEGCERCGRCADICPSYAIEIGEEWSIDAGKCIFCMDCLDVCPMGIMTSVEAPLYALRREDLVFSESSPPKQTSEILDRKVVGTFGKSISVRELDTGSCNACEIEVNNMANPFYDMNRFGIGIVASPRHADMLLATGPMSRNMRNAALDTYDAVPSPKIVVALGTCAISGGIYVKGDVFGTGINDTVKVDLFIPGCPPSPDRMLSALLKAFGHDQ
jgi:Ni,Fe-hydrogenase III small subunit/ferredoxin